MGYSDFEYPWRIKAFELGEGPGSRKEGAGGVAWIAETRATRAVSGGMTSEVLRVPLTQLDKIEQKLGKLSETDTLGRGDPYRAEISR